MVSLWATDALIATVGADKGWTLADSQSVAVLDALLDHSY